MDHLCLMLFYDQNDLLITKKDGSLEYQARTLKSNLIHSYAYINKIRAKYIEELIKFCGKGTYGSVFLC